MQYHFIWCTLIWCFTGCTLIWCFAGCNLFYALLASAWSLLGCSVGVTSAGATVVRWRLVICCSLQTPAASSAPAPPDGPLHVASESRNGSNGSSQVLKYPRTQIHQMVLSMLLRRAIMGLMGPLNAASESRNGSSHKACNCK